MHDTALKTWARKTARKLRKKVLGLQPFEDSETYSAGPEFDRAAARIEALASGGDFSRLFWTHTGRSVHKWPHYFAIYDACFAPYRKGFPLPDGTTRPLKFLEIGVNQGGSLQIWRKFFGAARSLLCPN